LVSFALANLPFLSYRLFVFLPTGKQKSLAIRLLELVVFYLLTGCLGLVLENRFGQNAIQNMEFYAVTFILFVTLAFPGYLLKHSKRP